MSRPNRVLDTSQVNIGKLHDETVGTFMQRVTTGDDRRHRFYARALRDLRKIGQHE